MEAYLPDHFIIREVENAIADYLFPHFTEDIIRFIKAESAVKAPVLLLS
ncbi:MAG: hypothetical protein JW704_01045 [Anaerolineaceae bacterium]|nr:hypothetical protein [Anaerolineaceae bacterium]MBN2678101.1 hypothetical protein [Anaerolineaceae bacterium]